MDKPNLTILAIILVTIFLFCPLLVYGISIGHTQLFFILGDALYAVIGFIQLFLWKHRLRRWELTSAQVVGYLCRNINEYAPIVEFETEGGETVRESYVLFDREKPCAEGDSLLICYNPRKPETFFLAGRESEILFLKTVPWFGIAVGGVALNVMCYYFANGPSRVHRHYY